VAVSLHRLPRRTAAQPDINSAAGVPAAAGKNTAILKNEINIASAAAVRKNNAENP
jgi:hypothetical protein